MSAISFGKIKIDPAPACDGCQGGRERLTGWWSCSICDALSPEKCRALELEDEIHGGDDDFFGKP